MTPYQIFITPTALYDMEDAVTYYNDRQENLGNRFAGAVDAGLEKIAGFPKAYGYRYKDVRGKFLRQFPYFIMFRIDEAARQVQVIRIFNIYQDPKRYRG